MKFSALLFILYNVLKIASFTNSAFKKYIGKVSARVLIKTEDGERARMIIFDKGKLSSIPGDQKKFDVALVWKDAETGLR